MNADEGKKLDEGKARWDLLPFDALDQVSMVLTYGAAKYTIRGDCTCQVRDTRSASTGEAQAHARSVATSTSAFFERGTQASLRGSASTQSSGGSSSQRRSDNSASNDKSVKGRSRQKNAPSVTSSGNTDSQSQRSNHSTPMGAPSAGATSGRTSTTITSTVESADRSVTPATSASALSRELTAGLSEHSPTCGVHRVVQKGERNWEKGMHHGRLLGAALRHMGAYARGFDDDAESGLPHLAHAACCVLMLLALHRRGHGTDDRQVTR